MIQHIASKFEFKLWIKNRNINTIILRACIYRERYNANIHINYTTFILYVMYALCC